MDRPNFNHDNPETCVDKLFNMIQACRTDAAVMRGRKDFPKIDSETVKIAEALARELGAMR